MKILHTSDWHLGHQLYGYDRTEEQLDMLRQMKEIAMREQPDVFLVSGDVFHTSQPSAAVQRMFAEGVLELRRNCPQMTIVITAGNHDSASRHEVFRSPWKSMGVYMIGTLDLERSEDNIIEIPGKGFIVAIPFINERFMQEGTAQTLLDMVKERNADGLPVVLSAHTTVRGADFTGHSETSRIEHDDYYIGGIEGVDIEKMGVGYDYLALGHIHHEQFIHSGMEGAHHNVRYSGSPLAVSFDENYVHSVSIVEIKSLGARPDVRRVEIVNLRPLISLPEEGSTDWETALELLRNYPRNRNDYLRVNVTQATPLLPGYNDVARKAVEGKQCRFCIVNYKEIRKKTNEGEKREISIDEFLELNPVEIAQRYFEREGIEFDDELLEMFNEALEMARGNMK